MNELPDLKVTVPYTEDFRAFLNGDNNPVTNNEVEMTRLFNALLAHSGLHVLLKNINKDGNVETQFRQVLDSWAPKFKPKFDRIMADLNRLTPRNALAIVAIPHVFMHIASRLFPPVQNYPVTDSMRWIAALTTLKSESNFGLSDRADDDVFGPVQMKKARWDDAYKRMITSWLDYFNTPEVVALFEAYGLDSDVLATPPVYGQATYEQQIPVIVACLLQNEENIYKHWEFQTTPATKDNAPDWVPTPSQISYDGASLGKPVDNLALLMSPFKNLTGIVQPSYQTMFTAYHILPAWPQLKPLPVSRIHKNVDPRLDRYARDLSFATSVSSQWTTLSSMLDTIKQVSDKAKNKDEITNVINLIDNGTPSPNVLQQIKHNIFQMFEKW